MQPKNGIGDMVGGTPLVRLLNIEKAEKAGAAIYAKVEGLNPAGSVKDRVAKSMIEAAEAAGKLKAGGVIVEPTSGNTGIGLASVGIPRGYRVILTMPETMSKERRVMLAAYGAELVLTEGSKGMKGAIAKAEEIVAKTEGAFMPGQFENPANPQAHEQTTGPELWQATEGNIDILVAGVGTGGTVSGTGRYLKQKKAGLQVVAVEPAESPVLNGGEPGPHAIQGIGAGFIPANYDSAVVDEVVGVPSEQAKMMARNLVEREGILAGISSGAALWAAVELAKNPENEGKEIVVILPDSGDRYLSMSIYNSGTE